MGLLRRDGHFRGGLSSRSCALDVRHGQKRRIVGIPGSRSLESYSQLSRAKYPLALVSRLINLFGNDLLIGYDIGCGFSSTAENSQKVGPLVRRSGLRFCCNAFHGHAHCRKCQLRWHPLYLEGAGLEDFEGCERIFSESNNVARPTRHASKFHRRQAILRHFKQWNKDKYIALRKYHHYFFLFDLTDRRCFSPLPRQQLQTSPGDNSRLYKASRKDDAGAGHHVR